MNFFDGDYCTGSSYGLMFDGNSSWEYSDTWNNFKAYTDKMFVWAKSVVVLPKSYYLLRDSSYEYLHVSNPTDEPRCFHYADIGFDFAGLSLDPEVRGTEIFGLLP